VGFRRRETDNAMTSDRARKRAARARKAATGEPYTQARRAVGGSRGRPAEEAEPPAANLLRSPWNEHINRIFLLDPVATTRIIYHAAVLNVAPSGSTSLKDMFGIWFSQPPDRGFSGRRRPDQG
jgi:hypothetical protein